QAPARVFNPVTIVSGPARQSVLSLSYDQTVSKMWETVEAFFTHSTGAMIYTRFLRLGFTRAPDGSPFAPIGQPAFPYPMIVRNLRLGRNVNSPSDGV